jgi:hypothetical protein
VATGPDRGEGGKRGAEPDQPSGAPHPAISRPDGRATAAAGPLGLGQGEVCVSISRPSILARALPLHILARGSGCQRVRQWVCANSSAAAAACLRRQQLLTSVVLVLCLRPADPVEYVAAYLLKNNTVSRAALNAPHVPLPQLITGAGCYPFCNPLLTFCCSACVTCRTTPTPPLRPHRRLFAVFVTNMEVLSTLLMHFTRSRPRPSARRNIGPQ